MASTARTNLSNKWDGVHPEAPLLSTLGDGRCLLIAEGRYFSSRGERLFDLQVKGCGRTRFSRGLDGTMSLAAVLVEYDLSHRCRRENVQIPAERALLALRIERSVAHSTEVRGSECGSQSEGGDGRGDQQLKRRGILLRAMTSSMRIGTLELLRFTGNATALKKLIHYLHDVHGNSIDEEEAQSSWTLDLAAKLQTEQTESSVATPQQIPAAIRVLGTAILRIAKMVASWQANLFHHGRMSTDNILLVGETIDFESSTFIDDLASCECRDLRGMCWCWQCIDHFICNSSGSLSGGRFDASSEPYFHHNRRHLCTGTSHSTSASYYPFCLQPIVGYECCLRMADALTPLISTAGSGKRMVANATFKLYWDTFRTEYERIMIEVRLRLPRATNPPLAQKIIHATWGLLVSRGAPNANIFFDTIFETPERLRLLFSEQHSQSALARYREWRGLMRLAV